MDLEEYLRLERNFKPVEPMTTTKQDTYVEMYVSECYPFPLQDLKDLIARAEASGLNEAEVIIDKGYYGDVEGITIRATKSK